MTVKSIFVAAFFGVSFNVAAQAETVTKHLMTKDKSEYPCFLELHTDEAKKVVIQLSDYKDVWSIRIVVPNRPEIFQNFFSEYDVRDQEKLDATFKELVIGSSKFRINEVNLLAAGRDTLDENSAAFLSVHEKHNVVAAIDAMSQDGISIPGLFELSNTVTATEDYRSCSLEAMGVSSGEKVEFDSRAEFRMIFEESFETWLTYSARAEACLQAQLDEDDIEEVIAKASDVFFPGILNTLKRRSYSDDLRSQIPFAKLDGFAEASSGGCMMAGNLAKMARLPMEQAIEAATD